MKFIPFKYEWSSRFKLVQLIKSLLVEHVVQTSLKPESVWYLEATIKKNYHGQLKIYRNYK